MHKGEGAGPDGARPFAIGFYFRQSRRLFMRQDVVCVSGVVDDVTYVNPETGFAVIELNTGE